VLENPILDIFGLNDERFVHRYARRQRLYERSLLEQNPALVVAASSDPVAFRACYSSSHFLIRDRVFGQRYKRFSVVRSALEDYHYFIFVRRDLALAAPAPRAAAAPPSWASPPWSTISPPAFEVEAKRIH